MLECQIRALDHSPCLINPFTIAIDILPAPMKPILQLFVSMLISGKSIILAAATWFGLKPLNVELTDRRAGHLGHTLVNFVIRRSKEWKE